MVLAAITVKFFHDDSVEKVQYGKESIAVGSTPLSERGTRKGRRNTQHAPGCNGLELSPLHETDGEIKEVFFKPTELLENEENHIRTSAVFGFQTPKKKLTMLEKAGSATKTLNSPRTPNTPRSALRSHPSTPKTPNTPRTPNSAVKSNSRTPRSKRRLSEVAAATPYSFRKRVKQRITEIVCDEDGSSSGDDDSDYENYCSASESDDNDDEAEDEFKENSVKTPRKTPNERHHLRLGAKLGTPRGTPSRTPRRARKIKDVSMFANSEAYFTAIGNTKKIATSDHTLSLLKTPRLTPDVMQTVLSGVASSHPKERQALFQQHTSAFSQWMTFLCEGFSLFLYGLGSKKNLLSTFQQEYLADYDHIVVNGFFPSLSLKSILNTITEDILGNTGSYHGVIDQMDYIKSVYSRVTADPLFIIIHNLDGPMLRASKTQAVLAQLVALTSVHLVASFDHINAPLILDNIKMKHYNALWIDATTLDQYTEETSFENSLLLQQSGSLTLSSLIHVFKSLTPNGKGVFLLLAKHQIDQKDNSSYTGISFVDLRQRCWEKFLVNSDLSLRAQLTEFKDHKLIRFKKGLDGVENITIPVDASKLKDFIEEQESNDI